MKIKNRKKKTHAELLKLKRKIRDRNNVISTESRPRMLVTRSLNNIYVQVIDDKKHVTVVSASSFEKGNHFRANKEGCKKVGETIAKRCLEKEITQVVFDKNGSLYHGRVKEVADAARASGLKL